MTNTHTHTHTHPSISTHLMKKTAMQSRALAVSAFLFSCSLIYFFIWNKIPGEWLGVQPVNHRVQISDIFWRTGDLQVKGNLLNPTPMPSVDLTLEKNTEETLERRTTSQPSEFDRQVDMTPIPILYKKSFKNLPEWNFEDVYMQSSGEQRPVCSTSLQKSRDKEFQEAAMWNIQLWFQKDHLNVREWNRLARFNNPFGFMEYRYSDIRKAVDLIPKSSSDQFLPAPINSTDGCIRCAVVGTSGILNGSGMGKEIDSHHYVFRVNGAVTEGFQDDVGEKTSVYVHTSYSLNQSLISLEKFGFRHIPQDEGIKYVLIPEGLPDFEWLEGLLQNETMSNKSHNGSRFSSYYRQPFNRDAFRVLHPDFLRYVRNRFLLSKYLNTAYWAVCRPTNGAFTLFLALHTCDIVDVYGFITADYSKYPNYYYERDTKSEVIFYLNHDYELEMKTWKKLHDAGIINLYQRHEE